MMQSMLNNPDMMRGIMTSNPQVSPLISMYLFTYIYVHGCLCVYIHVCVYMYMYMCVSLRPSPCK